MNRVLWYDRQGKPLHDMREVELLLRDRAYKVIRQTKLPGSKKWVSTVWLGLDHNFRGDGPPVIFETMVFPCYKGKPYLINFDMRRYTSEIEAYAGHVILCRYWRLNRKQRRSRHHAQNKSIS